MAHCELPSNACRNARICPEDTRQQPPIKEAPAVRIIFACVPSSTRCSPCQQRRPSRASHASPLLGYASSTMPAGRRALADVSRGSTSSGSVQFCSDAPT